MTSVSQQPSIPSQAPNSSSASQASTQSYANTAKKAVSSPPIATGSSTPSPAVAVGGSAPVQQHGKTSSISPVNGRTSVPPAVPAVHAPAIANSSSATNGASVEHNRKSSVTISANGPSGYINGAPGGGSKGGIQFGSLADSPAVSHSVPQPAQTTASAPIAIANSNNRIPSPAQSPSPIPQPAASGGRPPSVLAQQGNGPTFGSLGGDGDRHMRQVSAHQSPLGPAANQPAHLRRESSQSMQGDMGNQGSGRGNYAGRGRGGFNNQNNHNQFQQQQIGYPPAQYRQTNQNRGMASQPFQNQGRQPFQNSPHTAARSPAMTNATPGSTPNMGQAMPMPQPHAYGGYYPNAAMGPNQVHESSTFTPHSDFTKFNGRGGKGKRNAEKSFSNFRSREHFGHDLSFQPMPERQPYGHHGAMGSGQTPPFHPGHGVNVPPPHFIRGPPMVTEGYLPDQPNMPPMPPRPQYQNTSLLPPPGKIDLSPASGNFERILTSHQFPQGFQGGYPGQFDPRMMGMGMGAPGAQMYPHQMYMAPQQPPQSPQMNMQQPSTYTPSSYPPQGQAMSRNSSQMSEQRPPSSMAQPQAPAISSNVAQNTPMVAQSPSFTRKPRVSAAIAIKRPDGETLDVENLKAPNSPAPSSQTKTPPVIASTPTPPPKSATPQLTQHARKDSVKTSEQIKSELAEKIQKAKAGDAKAGDAKPAESQAKDEEPVKTADAQVKEDDKVKEETKVAEDAKALEDARAKKESDAKAKEESDAKAKEESDAKAKDKSDAKAAADKAKQDEDDELERQIREMEEAEAEREKKEAELLAKRNAEKAAVDKANEEARKTEAAENDRTLREQEREMERLEDEREQKRAEAEAKKASAETEPKKEVRIEAPEDEKAGPNTPDTLASKLSSLTLGTDSGTSTPASDDSMGPPPAKNAAGEKRGKPAALNLAPLNTKPVEPPQPSAALQSLKSARFLTHIAPSLYPSNISSPNPALNSAVTTKGKSFKYDKEFLLQFQKVFTEKPSMEFEAQIKALITGDGDGSSARTGGSTRGTPAGMGPRGSNRNMPGPPSVMGSFGAFGKTLPPGTTSDQRFAMSSGNMARPAMNPMASFNRPGGAFPGGNPMSRNPSTSGMNAIPQSPRQQSRSTRGGSKRDNYSVKDSKAEAAAAKTMPLTAGMDLKPIQTSSSGWKPRSIGNAATGAAGPAPGGPGHMEPDMVQRKVKAALNKMTPEKFDKIADQILAIAAQSRDEADGRTLRQVIQLTFEKATDEAHWASMYAKFCKRMLETMSPDVKDESILDKNGQIVCGGNLFRKYLLNRCQEEFERGWKLNLPEKPEGEPGDEKTEEATMLSDEYYVAAAAKRRGLGLVQFIGELYKLGMLTERIMHECVKKLVDYTGIPDEAEIESLTKLLRTIGANLDSSEKGSPVMDIYFVRIKNMVDTPELPSRLKFMLMDIIDLRKKRWQSKEANKGPKTLEEVRAEAEAAAQLKAAENARSNQRGGGGGGGGRMTMGRGDGRNFSNQYNNQPPPDHNRHTVGMDDLRRLTNKGGSNRNTSTPTSFGPTSMFSSRSNSGRKMGPGGSLSRTGEDSGASSRTGTPPQQKEKESATSANAFSLLASLGSGSGEPENAASPPSTHVSPALSKVAPAKSDKPEDKKADE